MLSVACKISVNCVLMSCLFSACYNVWDNVMLVRCFSHPFVPLGIVAIVCIILLIHVAAKC